MNNPNRDLLVLFNHEIMTQKAIEHEVEQLHQLLYTIEGIDNLIVSQGLLSNKATTYCTANSGQIYNKDWLVMPDDQAPGVKPVRTYNGPQYVGGFSDHLPVYLDLYFR